MAELAPNDTLKTIGQGGRRVWLYPTWFRGKWMTLRTVVHWVLLAMLLVGPWIDVAGHPAIRIDIPARRIYLWGLQFFATDGSYLLFVFGILVFSVFLVTALFGRAWCGWACPQTVFLESLIRPIERLIEGNAHRRRKLDAAPWTASKIAKKLTKWTAFAVVGGAIGTTFTAYFLGRDGVLEAQLDPFSHPAGTATFVFITGLLFFDFFWFREQTCLVVCPYGRLQSVLLDANSLLVAYDEKRGEPRGKKNTPGAGDCVDCRRCVEVCPTGTDIRKGTTMECIQCMACIDACDDVMSKLVRPEGLIRFSSENAISGQPQRIVRPRVLAYAGGLLGIVATASIVLSNRQPVELSMSRALGAPYVVLEDGRVQNPLRLRISNKGDAARAFDVEVLEPADAQITVPVSPFPVPPGEVRYLPVFVTRPATAVDGSEIVLRVSDDAGFADDIDAVFMGGGRG